jgi:acetolactate synthase-1/2/3 large subunit
MNETVTTRKPETTTAEDTLKQKTKDANVISGGHLVAKALKAEGVDTIFTLCGGHIIDIYDGCIDEGIRIVDVRHEQTAAHAADGYARQTGRLGCVVTTAGPGCTNAVTGIATAFRSESPVLHIGGQSALAQWRMGGLQDLPHVDMMRPITKFASTVMSTERVADMVSMAARECFAGAYGPAYLEIPRDVLDREIDVSKAILPKPGHYRASPKSIGDPNDVQRLADILVNAERPAILFGQQVWAARGHNEAIALLRGLDIPGYFNGGSRGTLPPGDPHHFDRTRSLAFGKATSSSSSARRSTSGWATASGSARRRWSRSTWTTAPSARIATSPSALSAIPARFVPRCCKPPRAASRTTSGRHASNG